VLPLAAVKRLDSGDRLGPVADRIGTPADVYHEIPPEERTQYYRSGLAGDVLFGRVDISPPYQHRSRKGEKMRKALLLLAVLGSVASSENVFAADTDAVEFLNSGKVLPTNLPFSEAVRVGSMLYLSGQIGIVPGSRKLVEGGIREEARQTMANIKTSLEAHGYAMTDVVKCTVMLADISEWGTFNEVYKSFFSGRYPARSALGANGLAMGARVEVECIAAK
jgi:reactive intermediate/imine deaminase